MRALIFSMKSGSMEPEVVHLINTLEAAGYSCVGASYSTTDYLPRATLAQPTVPSVTLFEGGLVHAPRCTAEDYCRADGAVENFADLALHDHAAHGYPLSEERLNPESAYYQRLRGVALKTRNLLRAVAPDLVVAPHGAEPISRAIAIEAAKLHIPTLIWESPFFPGFINLDVGAQHFFQRLTRIDFRWKEYSRVAQTEIAMKAIEEYVARWRAEGVSKYPQASNTDEIDKLRKFTESRDKPIVFLPAQIPWDANVLPGLAEHATLLDLYSAAITQLNAGWRVVIKAHPKDETSFWEKWPQSDEVLVVRDVSIHELIARADIVLVHSSNVGLEALLLGRPVVVLGTPFYARRGLTVDVDSISELRTGLTEAIQSKPHRELLHKFLQFILSDHLIPIGDGGRCLARIEEAKSAAPEQRRALQHLANAYPERARRYLKLARLYDDLARRNWFDSEIRAALKMPAERNEADRSRLDSGERQVPFDYCEVEPLHLARYMFAADFIAGGARILDIACGAGYGAHLLAERGHEVIAVDASAPAIEFAQEYWAHSKVDFQISSAGRWFESRDETYDAIVSFETIEHMYDAHLFFSQAWSHLRPGGAIFLSTPNAEHYPLIENLFHVRHLDKNDLVELFHQQTDLETHAIWPQGRESIGSAVRAGRFLVAVATKRGGQPVVHRDLAGRFPYLVPHSPTRKSFRIGADAFSVNGAVKERGRIVSDFTTSDCHIVYGPYRRLAEGRYEVSFHLEALKPVKAGDGRIRLEVVNTRDEFMASHETSGRDLLTNRDSGRLVFENRSAVTPIEFRIYVSGQPLQGGIAFRGVSLERLVV